MRAGSAPIALAILLWAGSAAAQEVSGRVWYAGGGAAAEAVVELSCSGVKGDPARADANGAYALTSPRTGRCIVKVKHGRAEARTVIHVSDSTRANLELRRSGKAWSLTRR